MHCLVLSNLHWSTLVSIKVWDERAGKIHIKYIWDSKKKSHEGSLKIMSSKIFFWCLPCIGYHSYKVVYYFAVRLLFASDQKLGQ